MKMLVDDECRLYCYNPSVCQPPVSPPEVNDCSEYSQCARESFTRHIDESVKKLMCGRNQNECEE